MVVLFGLLENAVRLIQHEEKKSLGKNLLFTICFKDGLIYIFDAT